MPSTIPNLNISETTALPVSFGKKISENPAVTKVMADISFLQERIAQVKSYSAPNAAVLRSYSDMLTRRTTALSMLLGKS